MRLHKKLTTPMAVVVVGVAVWQLATRVEREEPRPTRALLGQVWIERMPRDTRDMIRQFVAFETERRRLGLASAMSHWRVIADRFTWSLDGDQLHARFPQAEQSVTFTARTFTCKDTAPKPFELCLELSVAGKTLRLYSREDWRVDPEGELEGDVPVPVAPLLAPEDAPDDDTTGESLPSVAWPPAWY